MNIQKNTLNNKLISEGTDLNNRFDFRLNLTTLGVFVFTLHLLTLKTFISKPIVSVILLLIAFFFIILGIVSNKKGIVVTKVDVMWSIFIGVFFINIIILNKFDGIILLDMIVYLSSLIFLILVKVDSDNYKLSLKFIKFSALVYAMGVIFHYVSTDAYSHYILPLFTSTEQINIATLHRNGAYSGFTNQTAHAAGFLVNGLAIILFSYKKKYKSFNITKTLLIILLILFALILTGKRGHTLFMFMSLIITYICTVKNVNFVVQLLKRVVSITAIITVISITFYFLTYKMDLIELRIVDKLIETSERISTGEDITSGRTLLYSYSLDLFKDNPMFGGGWREVRANTLGLVSEKTGSHPHNIYIQLLSELGIIGLVLFIVPVIYIYQQTFIVLRFVINNSKKNENIEKWAIGIKYSFYSQTFFLLYGLTGNLLSDYNFFLMYIFSVSISMSAIYRLSQKNLALN